MFTRRNRDRSNRWIAGRGGLAYGDGVFAAMIGLAAGTRIWIVAGVTDVRQRGRFALSVSRRDRLVTAGAHSSSAVCSVSSSDAEIDEVLICQEFRSLRYCAHDKPARGLPNLNTPNIEELKAVTPSQHERLLSKDE